MFAHETIKFGSNRLKMALFAHIRIHTNTGKIKIIRNNKKKIEIVSIVSKLFNFF